MRHSSRIREELIKNIYTEDWIKVLKLVVMMMQSIDDEDLILIWPEWANFSISKQFKRVKPQDSNRPHFSHFITLKFCLIKSRLLWIVSCPLLGYQQWCAAMYIFPSILFLWFFNQKEFPWEYVNLSWIWKIWSRFLTLRWHQCLLLS